MDKRFYNGFEKQAFVGGALKAGWGAAKAGFGAAKNIYQTSGMRKAVGQMRNSGRRAINQGRQQLQKNYPKQMASARAMNNKVKTTATNIMHKAKNKMGY